MRKYADFGYYMETYKGTVIPDDMSFDNAIRETSAFLREITYNRIGEEISEDVKDAACSAAEVWHMTYGIKSQENDNREIKSENTDGYSVSYVTEGKDGETREETVRKKMYLAARKYLIHTGLLYAGVDADVY